MKKILLPILLGGLFFAQEKNDTALLIVDIQMFYFPGGFSELVNPEQTSLQAAKLLKHFRETNQTVVHIKHKQEKQEDIHPNVAPKDGEKVITKHFVNSFRETDLLDYLKSKNIKNVVICGMMTNMCVQAVSRASADFGFNVTVISDACTTKDYQVGNEKITARDMHWGALASINNYYGKVLTIDEYLK